MNKIISKIILIGVLIVVFVEFFHPIRAITQDLGRHLKTGEIIVHSLIVPKTNLFSYTYPKFPFINSHWLSEVLIYIFVTFGGFFGLLLVMSLIAVMAFGILLWISSKFAKAVWIGVAAFLYIGILAERTDVRPEIFSFLFLSIFIAILFKNRQKFTGWIFLLPVLEVLWVNVHIYFIMGIILVAIFIFDDVLVKLQRIKNHELGIMGMMSKNLLLDSYFLLLVFLLTCIAMLLNPNGLAGALYPFNVFHNYGYTIEENQNIFFLDSLFFKPTILFFKITAVTLFILLLINWRKTKPVEWFLAIVFTVLAINAERNLLLFVGGTFVVFAKCFNDVAGDILRKVQRVRFYNGIASGVTLVMTKKIGIAIMLLAFLWEVMFLVSHSGFGYKLPSDGDGAVRFMKINNINGPMFNNFDIGSFLDYKLYPREKVFVDGRPEAYPASFFSNVYIPMQEDLGVFNRIAAQYKFNVIYFAHTDQTPWAENFSKIILTDSNWKLVYLDDSIMVLVKNSAVNKKIISEYEITPQSFRVSPNVLQDKDSLMRYAHFFSIAGWAGQELIVLQAIHTIDPNNCPVLYNLASLTSSSAIGNFYMSDYQNKCRYTQLMEF